MEQSVVGGIDGSWNHQRNGLVHTVEMADADSRAVVDFEIVQHANPPGRGSMKDAVMEWKWKQ
jgi:hypothetical protein